MSALALVTGTPGWLGSRLVQVLKSGLPEIPSLPGVGPDRPVRMLRHRGAEGSANTADAKGVEAVTGDVCNPQDLKEFCRGAEGATLFHCAGVIHPSYGIRQLYDVNRDGTRNLLEAAAAAGVRRFVYVSSNSPIGLNPNAGHVFDENSPYNPYMNYGRSKMEAEQVVGEFQQAGKIETVVIRPPWFYGINQPARQSLFFSMIREGKAPIVGSGENKRSMAYVDNICQGLILCESTPAANGQTYWIADRRPYTMNEIVDTIERLLEKEFGMQVAHKRMRLPGFAGDVATVVDSLIQSTGRYHQKFHVLSEMNKTIACRVDKAQRELGYDPKVELEEGMRRSIRWCLDQGHKI